MPIKERFQNPIKGDQIRLKLIVYNCNNPADVEEVQKVDIYFSDPTMKSESNPHGLRLIETIESENVTRTDVGAYEVLVTVDKDKYSIGYYCDVWTLNVREDEPNTTSENHFQVYPDLWYATPLPIVHDFKFSFRPNKLRHGEKRHIQINIEPNVASSADLWKLYENIAIASPVRISIEQECGPCVPAEQDLRLIVDCETVDLRDKMKGFYFIDTTDMDCGIYNVWFNMDFAGSTYISGKQQLQIF